MLTNGQKLDTLVNRFYMPASQPAELSFRNVDLKRYHNLRFHPRSSERGLREWVREWKKA